jgi:hypothetical protein
MERRGVARRSSIALAFTVLTSPIVLSGCIFGFPFAPLPNPRQSPAPSVSSLPSPTTRADVPELPIATLPDAPAFALWAPLADARIRISTWRSGAISAVLDVPLLNHDPVYLDHVRVSVAPTGQFVAVVEAADGPTISRAFVRIVSIAGDLVWTATGDVTAHPTIRWSPDGTRFAVDARRRWLVVEPRTEGATTIAIDSRRAVSAGGGDYPWELLDFSEDGQTIFGSRSAGLVPDTFPLVSVPSQGGAIQPLDALPIHSGQRLATLRQLTDDPLEGPIDPQTGQLAVFSITGKPSDVEIAIRSGAKAREFALPGGAGGPVDMSWQAGSLLVLHDGPEPNTQRLGFVSTGAELGKERTVMTIPIVGLHGRLVAMTDRFAILAFGRGFGEAPSRLLLVQLRDGSATLVDADGMAGTNETFGFAGWLPSPGPAVADAQP